MLRKRQRSAGRLEFCDNTNEQPRFTAVDAFWTPWTVAETVARMSALWAPDIFAQTQPRPEMSLPTTLFGRRGFSDGTVVAEAYGFTDNGEPFVLRCTLAERGFTLDLGARGARELVAIHMALLGALEGVAPRPLKRAVTNGTVLRYPPEVTISAAALTLARSGLPEEVMAPVDSAPVSQVKAVSESKSDVAVAASRVDLKGEPAAPKEDVCVHISPDRTMACAIDIKSGKTVALSLSDVDDPFDTRATCVTRNRYAAVCTERGGRVFVIDFDRSGVYRTANGKPLPMNVIGWCGDAIVCQTMVGLARHPEFVIIYDTSSDARLLDPPRLWAVPRNSSITTKCRGSVTGVLSWSQHDPRSRVTLHSLANGKAIAHIDLASQQIDTGALTGVIETTNGCVVAYCSPGGWCSGWCLIFLEFVYDGAGAVYIRSRTQTLSPEWSVVSIECDTTGSGCVRVNYHNRSGSESASATFSTIDNAHASNVQ